MEFSRQEYWSGLPFPTPGNLPHSGTEPIPPSSPALAGRFFTTAPPGKLSNTRYLINICCGKRQGEEDKRLEKLPREIIEKAKQTFLLANGSKLTFASGVTTGFGGNCTSVALRIVFSCRMSCWDWLWPKGYHIKKKTKNTKVGLWLKLKRTQFKSKEKGKVNMYFHKNCWKKL